MVGELVRSGAGPSSNLTTAPAPSASEEAKEQPLPTRTPIPEPTTTPQPEVVEQPWEFTTSTLSIPSMGVQANIVQYTPEMLVDVPLYDMEGRQVGVLEDAVVPQDDWSVAWYTGIPGTKLSDSTEAPIYGYAHTRPDGQSVFSGLNGIQLDALATITTETETLTYKVADVFEVPKEGLTNDPRVSATSPDAAEKLILFTCSRPEGYDPNAPTVDNFVVIAYKVHPDEPAPFDARFADRL